MFGLLASVYGSFLIKFADVYDFYRELMTYGKVPYAGIANKDVITGVAAGMRLQQPEGCSEDIYLVMLNCWNKEPTERPSFSELAEIVDAWVGTCQETDTIMRSDSLQNIEEFYN